MENSSRSPFGGEPCMCNFAGAATLQCRDRAYRHCYYYLTIRITYLVLWFGGKQLI